MTAIDMQSNKYEIRYQYGTVPTSISVQTGKLVREQNNSRTYMDSMGLRTIHHNSLCITL
jgi:hypothetical protein